MYWFWVTKQCYLHMMLPGIASTTSNAKRTAKKIEDKGMSGMHPYFDNNNNNNNNDLPAPLRI